MKKFVAYLLLLAIGIGAACWGAAGFRMGDGGITLSLMHWIPAAIVTFPLGSLGIGLWLCDPLNGFLALLAAASLLLSPLAQISLWNLFQQRRKPA
jgi:hypothetical protein